MFKVLDNDRMDLKIKHRVFNEFLIFAVKNPTFLKDLDKAAATLASACQILLDTSFPDAELRTRLFEKISRDRPDDATANDGRPSRRCFGSCDSSLRWPA